jgi:hypothetical protein
LDGAEAVSGGYRGPTASQMLAAITANYVETLPDGTCAGPASCFNFDDGTLRCVPANPAACAVKIEPAGLDKHL